jgi:hypothetical protein
MLVHRAILLLCCFLFPVSLHAADSYVVNNGASLTITEHSVCAIVTNIHASGSAITVPTKSAAEWTSFRTDGPPAGVTAVICDTTPAAFAFADVTGTTPSTLTTATSITISGINTSTSVSVTGTGATISINGGAWVTSGNITNGQTLAVRLTSSASFSTSLTATVNVGGVTDAWSVTTGAAPSGVSCPALVQTYGCYGSGAIALAPANSVASAAACKTLCEQQTTNGCCQWSSHMVFMGSPTPYRICLYTPNSSGVVLGDPASWRPYVYAAMCTAS